MNRALIKGIRTQVLDLVFILTLDWWPVFSNLHDFPGFMAHVITHKIKFKLYTVTSFIF